MPKQNPYLIENKKPIELVQELEKYEIKKSPLSPAARSKVIRKWGSDYVSENREDYGPGNEQSRSIAKKIGSVALATTYFTPLGAITAPMTVVAAGTGGTMWVVGNATDSDDLKEAGSFIFGTAVDAGIEGLSAGTLNAGAPVIAKLTKETCKVISELGDMKDKIEALERRGVYIPTELTPQQRAQFVSNLLKYGL